MGKPAHYSQLNAGEKTKYMELDNRVIGLTEKVERTNQRATSLLNMVLSGDTHRLWQTLSNAILSSKIKQIEDEMDALFGRIDARLGTETPHPRSHMYKQMILAGSEKDYHL